MSDDYSIDLFTIGLGFGAVLCLILVVVGLVRFFNAEGRSGRITAAYFIAGGFSALFIAPAVTILLRKFLWGP
jgi:hypothetical protein